MGGGGVIPILGVILAIGLVCLTILIMWFIVAHPWTYEEIYENESELEKEEYLRRKKE